MRFYAIEYSVLGLTFCRVQSDLRRPEQASPDNYHQALKALRDCIPSGEFLRRSILRTCISRSKVSFEEIKRLTDILERELRGESVSPEDRAWAINRCDHISNLCSQTASSASLSEDDDD